MFDVFSVNPIDFLTVDLKMCVAGKDDNKYFFVEDGIRKNRICFFSEPNKRNDPPMAHIDMCESDVETLHDFLKELDVTDQLYHRFTKEPERNEFGKVVGEKEGHINKSKRSYRLLIKSEQDYQWAIQIVHELAKYISEGKIKASEIREDTVKKVYTVDSVWSNN